MAQQQRTVSLKTEPTRWMCLAFAAGSLSLGCSASAWAEFNMSFVHGSENVNAAHAVAEGNALPPGEYPFAIYLNKQQVDNKVIRFTAKEGAAAQPCLTVEDLLNYGVKLPDTLTPGSCVDVAAAVNGATLSFDPAVQQIDLSVPQVMLAQHARGAIPTTLYDQGINAAFSNYSLNYNRNSSQRQSGQNSEYTFLSLNNGLNLWNWRLRNNMTMNKVSGQAAQWDNIATWAETDIASWRSRLQLGQASTNNTVFNSIQFRGAQLSSVDDMLPESLRGYAPVVRGVAATNARVDIRQNGYVVYSTNVAPGPFEIRDIYPHSNSGDLQVTVNEADGTRKHFTVSYSSIANMLREGIWNYQLTAGRYQNGDTRYTPNFMQGTLARGIAYGLTPYGGLIVADNYRAAALGVAKNMGEWGAISIDGSYSDTTLANGERARGQSYRFLYSKSLNQMGTNVQLAGYRYATSGYYDFADAVEERSRWRQGIYENNYYNPGDEQTGIPDLDNRNQHRVYTSRYANKRERVDVSINQQLWQGATLYANVSSQSYWGGGGRDRTVQLGYNDAFKRISYGVYLQDTRSQYGYADRSINLSVSIPLNWGRENHSASLNVSGTHSRQSGDSYNTGISGTALSDQRLSYALSTGHTESAGQSSALNLGYRGAYGNLDGSYSYSNSYNQLGLGLSGGVLLHSGGVTLSQPLQNTVILVEAKHASGVRLDNQTGVAIDPFGYAVVPSATPYRFNAVALHTQDFEPGLDVPVASKQVVPTEKAIVKVRFDTFYGVSLLIHSHLNDGGYPAVGASVFNPQGRNSGTVGLNGDLYVSGAQPGEKLTLRWGNQPGQQCTLALPSDLSMRNTTAGYQELTLPCQTQ
ncbi:fimbria/pilus outer membrane usher protein [Edwardsiella piscicida]|uniref:fimbria/pilus outer membrane usher protein n=1 Tax=Edwardsiella piscicida TaxID=1263550 RepID=UPI00370D012C